MGFQNRREKVGPKRKITMVDRLESPYLIPWKNTTFCLEIEVKSLLPVLKHVNLNLRR